MSQLTQLANAEAQLEALSDAYSESHDWPGTVEFLATMSGMTERQAERVLGNYIEEGWTP